MVASLQFSTKYRLSSIVNGGSIDAHDGEIFSGTHISAGGRAVKLSVVLPSRLLFSTPEKSNIISRLWLN